MSKHDKPLTVRRLKEIMNSLPEDMVTDALVLVSHETGDREYSIVRTGQFSVVPNLTFTIAPNVHGLFWEPKLSSEETRSSSAVNNRGVFFDHLCKIKWSRRHSI